jgi:hypothetical protein
VSKVHAPYSRPEELTHTLTAALGIVACGIAIPWLAWAAAGVMVVMQGTANDLPTRLELLVLVRPADRSAS